MLFLLKFLKRRLLLTVLTFALSVLTAIATLWWNLLLSDLINAVSAGQRLSVQGITSALVAILLVSVTTYAKGWVSGFTCETIAHDLRMGYAHHFVALPIQELESLNNGEQVSRLQNEIGDVSGYISGNLFQLFDDGLRFLLTFSWLLFLNPMLTISANLPTAAILVYVVWASKTIGAATRKSQQAKSKMNRYTDTLLNLFPVIQLYDAVAMTRNGYQETLTEWEEGTVKLERTKARLLSLSALLSTLPLMLLFLIGGNMAISQTISIGTLYIFINLSGTISGVLMNMPGFVAAFRQFSANMRQLSSKITFYERG